MSFKKTGCSFLVVLTFLLSLGQSKANAFDPLIHSSQGNLAINPAFAYHQKFITQLVELSYYYGGIFLSQGIVPQGINHPLYWSALEKGWKMNPILGKTGGTYEDIPGIIASNTAEKTIVIAFRGTLSIPARGTSTVFPDWITNVDFSKATPSSHQLSIQGQLHQGFALKTKLLRSSLLSQLKTLFDSIPEEDRSRWQIFVSGHSQGGAVAQFAAAEIARFYRDTYEPSFDNRASNKIQVYRLSSVRSLGDEQARTSLNDWIGKNNNIRQNILNDAVPNLVPGENWDSVTRILNPFSKSQYTNYSNGGYLALQMSALEILVPARPVEQNWSNWSSEQCRTFANQLANHHFVTCFPNGGVTFDHRLVDNDLRTLLVNGASHIARKKGTSWSTWAIEGSTQWIDQIFPHLFETAPEHF